jgi:hypothetical protein
MRGDPSRLISWPRAGRTSLYDDSVLYHSLGCLAASHRKSAKAESSIDSPQPQVALGRRAGLAVQCPGYAVAPVRNRRT